MEFGLWIEPEMVNPDSDLYRAHPDWILSAGGRVPPLQRHQLVLDLTRPEVVGYLFERIERRCCRSTRSRYVKWDCNRDLVDAGQRRAGGCPGRARPGAGGLRAARPARARHPGVEWESCAAGGGRIDLAMLERVAAGLDLRHDRRARPAAIQRWTGQLVPPEYLGAHVSAPFSHQTGRYMPLSLRCATALFGHFGIEWDITQATEEERAELAAWIRLYQRHRALIHSGRVVDDTDDTAWMYGVVAPDGSAALVSYVQLDEPRNDQPPPCGCPGSTPPGATGHGGYRRASTGPGSAAAGAPVRVRGFRCRTGGGRCDYCGPAHAERARDPRGRALTA